MSLLTKEKYADFIKYYKDKPYEFATDVIGVKPSTQQEQLLKTIPRAMKERKTISIKSGHGCGKTAGLTWILLWFITTRPHPNIPCTANTQSQLQDVLWKEIGIWMKKLPTFISQQFEVTASHVRKKSSPETWFAVARTANTPEALQGFHAEHMVFLVDEASGVDSEIITVAQGALTGENNFMIMIGNPTRIEGTFYDSFTKNRESYINFTFNSEESELVDPGYCKRMEEEHGKDSDVYRVRVLGEFPKAEPDSFLSLTEVEEAVKRQDKHYLEDEQIHIGVDVARYGDDETVFCVRRGNKVLEFQTYKKLSIPETTGRLIHVIKECETAGLKVYVAVDDTGVGGGVTDLLNHYKTTGQHSAYVVGENNGSRPNVEEEFHNRGAELWWNIKKNIRKLDLPEDDTLMSELTTRKYKVTPSGKIQMEEKSKMKDRGVKSPDRADALSLTFSSDSVRRVYAFSAEMK